MSSFIGLEVTGVEDLIKDFKGYEKEAQKAMDKAIDDTSKAVESDAKKRLNGLFGSAKHNIHGGAGLLGSIYNRVVKTGEKVVGTSKEYAAYIEFGTGDLVEIPEGLESVAAQFRGKGIRKVNIKGDSYLNWAAINQRKRFIERISTNLNKIKK
jgi:hypothetical protein